MRERGSAYLIESPGVLSVREGVGRSSGATRSAMSEREKRPSLLLLLCGAVMGDRV